MMRKRKSLKGQLTLPYSRAARFAILRAAVFTLPGKSKRAFNPVYQLIEQLELCTFRDDCRVRQEVLAFKMRCCSATVARATKLAVELGILRVENDHANGGGMYSYKILSLIFFYLNYDINSKPLFVYTYQLKIGVLPIFPSLFQ